MNFDFASIMLAAVLITGVIWAIDLILFKPKRVARVDELKAQGASEAVQIDAYREPILAEYARSFFPVILVVLILRSFLIEPFRIPSGSMMPTLLAGDFILVNKFDYGIRLPVINEKIIDLGAAERGDVVVFRYPKDPSTDYIKRVIGVPGDTVEYRNKQLFINGEPIALAPMGVYTHSGTGMAMNGAMQLKENLGSVEHDILVTNGFPRIDKQVVVPEGHYFVMGDNRDNSNDSRVWGFVPDENLVGHAFMIWMSWDGVQNRISWERIGNAID